MSFNKEVTKKSAQYGKLLLQHYTTKKCLEAELEAYILCPFDRINLVTKWEQGIYSDAEAAILWHLNEYMWEDKRILLLSNMQTRLYSGSAS